MSLDDFDHAIAREGWLYELGKGVIEVSDAARKQMTVFLRWRGQWKKQVIKPPKKYTTRWLPGFSLDLKREIAAAGKARGGK